MNSKPEQEEEVCLGCVITLLSLFIIGTYLIVSLFCLGEGYDDKSRYDKYKGVNECEIQDRMTTYVFPAYKLGCWLGERTDE